MVKIKEEAKRRQLDAPNKGSRCGNVSGTGKTDTRDLIGQRYNINDHCISDVEACADAESSLSWWASNEQHSWGVNDPESNAQDQSLVETKDV